MPIEGSIFDIFGKIEIAFGVKAFLLLFLAFYTVFAIVIFRQIQLMGKTVYTPAVPFLKFIAIFHIGVSLAIFFILAGMF